MPAGPAGTHAQQILQRLLIDLSWNSSRLEGNTYSLLETERLIELGEATEGKSQTDAQMIRNHKAAIEFLVQNASGIGFDRRTVLNLHALLADGLLPDPRAPGRLRTKPVGIGGSVFHPWPTRPSSASTSIRSWRPPPPSLTPTSSRCSSWCSCRTCSPSTT